MKTVLLVPGFSHEIDSIDYRAVMKAIEAKGYKVTFVPIRWKRTVVDDWVRELERTYAKYDSAETILAGFSFGAVTAFVAAARHVPAELWLFSLSPAFDDDDRELKNPDKDTLRWAGVRRLRAFSAVDYAQLIKAVTCRTLIFYGTKEARLYSDLARRCKLAARQLPNAQLFEVPAAGHDISEPNYQATIQANI